MKLFYFLTLMRPANIVTSVADVIAGVAIAGFLVFPAVDFQIVLSIFFLALSTKCLYGGGIVFNDIFDFKSDSINRPERILPSGLITLKEASTLGIVLLITGVAAAAMVSVLSGLIAIAIAMLALCYNKFSKHYPVIGPINMGLCRGCNLLLGMSISTSVVLEHWYIGIIPIVFIAAVTLTAVKEIAGNNKTAIGIAMLLDALVTVLFLTLGKMSGLNIWKAVPFLLCWYGMNFFAKYRAITKNESLFIKKAVKTGVLSIIVLDASYVAGFSGWVFALAVTALLPISILLAKRFAVT